MDPDLLLYLAIMGTAFVLFSGIAIALGRPLTRRIQEVASRSGMTLHAPGPSWLALRARPFGRALALQHENATLPWLMEGSGEELFGFSYESNAGLFDGEGDSHHLAVYAVCLGDVALPLFALSRKGSGFGPGNIGAADCGRTGVGRFWKRFSLYGGGDATHRERVIALFDASSRSRLLSLGASLRSLETLPGGWIVYVSSRDEPEPALAAGRQIRDWLRTAVERTSGSTSRHARS